MVQFDKQFFVSRSAVEQQYLKPEQILEFTKIFVFIGDQ